MRFVDYQKGGEPDSLFIAQAEAPALTAGKVRVRVRGFGINRADTLQRQGRYPPPPGESEILGLEVAGTVIEVADDVNHWKVGDNVFGLVAGGGYAEEVVVLSSHLDTMTPREMLAPAFSWVNFSARAIISLFNTKSIWRLA